MARASCLRLACLIAALSATGPVRALDIVGVQNAALDQPRVNALLRLTPDGAPLTGVEPIFGDSIFNIQAFLDTGASGVIVSEQTADFLGVPRAPGVIFSDVGVGGSAQFGVSSPLHVDIAPFTLAADVNNPSMADTVYSQRFGPLRAQIGPLGVPSNPFLGGVDVFGMPTMAGKVVVMDPKPLDTLLDNMRTYVYAPGTQYKPQSADSDPGIPPTNRTVDLSFASFDRFTSITPPGAAGPTLAPNPFIGPDPLASPTASAAADSTPGVTLTLGDNQATGSFLLDTGAAASVISQALAADLHVRYRPGAADPVLELFDPANLGALGIEVPNQFVITLSGIGGDERAAGLFLDSLLVRTLQGNPADDNDPAHLRYVGAPVLVADIALKDPVTGDALTLDGLFAMNFLVASIYFAEPFTLGEVGLSPFRWVVFDHPNGVLALDVIAVPEPESYALMLIGLAFIAWRLRQTRTKGGPSRAGLRP